MYYGEDTVALPCATVVLPLYYRCTTVVLLMFLPIGPFGARTAPLCLCQVHAYFRQHWLGRYSNKLALVHEFPPGCGRRPARTQDHFSAPSFPGFESQR